MDKFSDDLFAEQYVRESRRELFLAGMHDPNSRNDTIARYCTNVDALLRRDKFVCSGMALDDDGGFLGFVDDHGQEDVRIISPDLGIDKWGMAFADALGMVKASELPSIIMGNGFALVSGPLQGEDRQQHLMQC